MSTSEWMTSRKGKRNSTMLREAKSGAVPRAGFMVLNSLIRWPSLGSNSEKYKFLKLPNNHKSGSASVCLVKLERAKTPRTDELWHKLSPWRIIPLETLQ